MKGKAAIFGLIAEFTGPEALLAAAEKTRGAGFRRTDAFAPFPVHGLADALGLKKTRMAMIVLICGVCGALGAYFMMWYSSVIAYPFNVGGRPPHSWPAFIPITFELTVLSAAFGALLGMLALNGLPQPYHPLFNVKSFAEHASRDRFFLLIQSNDPQFDAGATRAFLLNLEPQEVLEVPW